MVCLNATWESISHGDLSNVDFVIFFHRYYAYPINVLSLILQKTT